MNSSQRRVWSRPELTPVPDGIAVRRAGLPPRSLEGFRLALASDTFAPQLNGVTRTLERLTSAVRSRGGEVRVYTTSDPDAAPADDVLRCASMPFWAYPQLRIAAPTVRWLASDWEEWRPTLVHAATPFGVGLAAQRAAHVMSIPVVSSYHTSFSAYAQFYALGGLSDVGWSYLRWFHNRGARTYAPTHAVARELADRGFGNTRLWGRGVDVSRFSPAFRSTALRQSLGVPEGGLLVTYVGRVAREKGLDVLLDGMRLLPEQPDIRLVVVGDGPYLTPCRKRAPMHTTFTGREEGDRLSALFASSDIFVFPSATDTFGNVLLEAQASGVPIVAANSAPSRELLGDCGAQFYPAHSPEALADALVALARDPGARSHMARRGVEAASGYAWHRVFDGLFDDYLSVVGTGDAPERTTDRALSVGP